MTNINAAPKRPLHSLSALQAAMPTLASPIKSIEDYRPSKHQFEDAFKLPPDRLDEEGRKVSYDQDALALSAFFLNYGRFPDSVSGIDIHSAYSFAMGAPTRVVCRAMRFPPHSCSYADVYARIAELSHHRLHPPRIVEALAMPVEDHKGRFIKWPEVLKRAGAVLPVSSALRGQ